MENLEPDQPGEGIPSEGRNPANGKRFPARVEGAGRVVVGDQP